MSARLQDSRVATTAVNQHWLTPVDIVERIARWRPIGLDPCSNVNSRIPALAHFRGPGHVDGLTVSWARTMEALKVKTGVPNLIVYVNNPYEDNEIWLAKCAEESRAGVEIVQLIPNRSDVSAWHKKGYVRNCATHMCLLAGRLSYGGLSTVQMKAVGILQTRFLEQAAVANLEGLAKDQKKELESQEKRLVDHMMTQGPAPADGEDVFQKSGTAKFPSVLLMWGMKDDSCVEAFGRDSEFGFVVKVMR